jgi:hypothetical protein
MEELRGYLSAVEKNQSLIDYHEQRIGLEGETRFIIRTSDKSDALSQIISIIENKELVRMKYQSGKRE